MITAVLLNSFHFLCESQASRHGPLCGWCGDIGKGYKTVLWGEQHDLQRGTCPRHTWSKSLQGRWTIHKPVWYLYFVVTLSEEKQGIFSKVFKGGMDLIETAEVRILVPRLYRCKTSSCCTSCPLLLLSKWHYHCVGKQIDKRSDWQKSPLHYHTTKM